MAFPLRFGEIVKVVPALSHQTGAGARTADRVCLKNYAGCAILLSIYQGNAATTAITVDKDTAAGGGTESAGITLNNFWYCQDVTVGTTADTWTKGTAAASITSSATGSGTSYYLIDIQADELPEGGVDYDFLELNCGTSNSANYLNAVYLLYGPRYAGATLPTGQS